MSSSSTTTELTTPYYTSSTNNGPQDLDVQRENGSSSNKATVGAGALPVVQAYPYYNQSQQIDSSSNNSNHGVDGIMKVGRGEQQQQQSLNKKFRDPIWGILFYLHIIAILFATIRFVPITLRRIMADDNNNRLRYLEESNNKDDDDDLDIINAKSVILLLIFCGLGSVGLSTLALTAIMNCTLPLIKSALFFNIFVCFGLVITSFVVPSGIHIEMAFIAIVLLITSICYTYVVWNRIEFAASNLTTATTVIKSNMGLTFFAYMNLILSFLWSLWWTITAVSTFFVLGECDTQGNCQNNINGFVVFGFLVSYFWTIQILKNAVHVTVAGTVGTWWIVPQEANGCCSNGIRQSYWRSITTSFGSICLGSLLVALLQAIKEIIYSMRESGNGSILICLADVILGCIENVFKYFNQWAFVYVGIYGYAFVEAGSGVVNLFEQRGWTAIIADILIDTVLFMVSIGVSLLGGILGLIVAAAETSVVKVDSTYLAGSFM